MDIYMCLEIGMDAWIGGCVGMDISVNHEGKVWICTGGGARG